MKSQSTAFPKKADQIPQYGHFASISQESTCFPFGIHSIVTSCFLTDSRRAAKSTLRRFSSTAVVD